MKAPTPLNLILKGLLALALGLSTTTSASTELCASPQESVAPELEDQQLGFVWDARAVEHLYNRAAFGASPAQVEAALERQPAQVVEELLSGGAPVRPFAVDEFRVIDRYGLEMLEDFDQRFELESIRLANREQRDELIRWWFAAMISDADPLRDRMALFWHGFFTTSMRVVKRSNVMAHQHELLRGEALGNYAMMLRGVVHSPAMLEYLNNEVNNRGANNENLARELMELFSLGEGNYTEDDVQETARALTGMSYDKDGNYVFNWRKHDFGVKTVLGRTGRLDGDDVVDVLLEQDACARWVAGRIIEYFEGVWPSEERLDRYAELLRESGYDLDPLLRTLLLDPEFYRAEVRGSRVQGPVDFVIGASRRFDVPLGPEFARRATASLGQDLFFPPNVDGWEGGQAWVTTSTLMMRGNLAGMALGLIDETDVFTPAELSAATGKACEASSRAVRIIRRRNLFRQLFVALEDQEDMGFPLRERLLDLGLSSDAEIASYLLEAGLAIEPPADLRPRLESLLRREREHLGVPEGSFLIHEEAGPGLRRAAHWVLSLPAAQLS